MGKYGRAAVRARELYVQHRASSPEDAWKIAVGELFQSQSSREKGCPKAAFLGLCGVGLVKDIPPGDYTRSEDNKRYAVRAAARLKTKPALAENKTRLWSEVGEGKKANSQMDVVVALWKQGVLIAVNGPSVLGR